MVPPAVLAKATTVFKNGVGEERSRLNSRRLPSLLARIDSSKLMLGNLLGRHGRSSVSELNFWDVTADDADDADKMLEETRAGNAKNAKGGGFAEDRRAGCRQQLVGFFVMKLPAFEQFRERVQTTPLPGRKKVNRCRCFAFEPFDLLIF